MSQAPRLVAKLGGSVLCLPSCMFMLLSKSLADLERHRSGAAPAGLHLPCTSFSAPFSVPGTGFEVLVRQDP